MGGDGSTSDVGMGSSGWSAVIVGMGTSGETGLVCGGGGITVSVIGHSVVEIGIVTVITVEEPPGHSGISGPQSVTVWIEVVKMVEVLNRVVTIGSVGTGSVGIGSVGAGSVGAGPVGMGSVGIGSVGIGSVGMGSVGLVSDGMGSVGIGSVGAGSVGIGSVGAGSVEMGSVGMGSVGMDSVGIGSVGAGRDSSGIWRVVLGSTGNSSNVVLTPGMPGTNTLVLDGEEVSTAVMGQIVVEMAIVSVTTVGTPAEQPGASGPQSVMV